MTLAAASVVAVAAKGRAVFGPAVRFVVAALLVLAVALCLWRYPLSCLVLVTALLVYASVLWWRPVAFLIVLPCILPAWDLGIWTGWMMVGESDLFVLTTVAVLLIRTPPMSGDLVPRGAAGLVLRLFMAAWMIAAIVGLGSSLGAAPSDNVFLQPENALRLAKGFAEALAILPFLRQRQRLRGDTGLWLGGGMAAGIVVVTVIILAERSLFSGVFDLSGAYRVAGPFSSMRVGGGHVGAYLALSLPMTICLIRLRPRWVGLGLSLLSWMLGFYSLLVTFARTGYAAGSIAMVVACIGAVWTVRRRDRPVIPGLGLGLLIASVVLLAAGATGMGMRFADAARDFVTRQDNWRAGLAVRDTELLPSVFGMGLGTYQRAMLMRSLVNRPTDITVLHEADGAYVRLQVESPFFLGQKVIPPATGDWHLTMLVRSPDDHSAIGVLLCDKVLLYSDKCRGDGIAIDPPNVWQSVSMTLRADGLGQGAWLGMIHRPVELSLFGSPVGHRVDVRRIQLVDGNGSDALANGDFSRGLDRWIFTDDSHVSWRMLNQYLMLWFETGCFGVLAFLSLSGLALAGSVRAVLGGVVVGAGVAGSVTGFLICGLFDNVLEAPRLATLFFLVCCCGLLQWEGRRHAR